MPTKILDLDLTTGRPKRQSLQSLTLPETTSHDTPPTGEVAIYPKTDGKVYRKDDTGTETELGGGGVTQAQADQAAYCAAILFS